MNKAFNLHVFCKDSSVVMKYIDVLESALIDKRDKSIECIYDGLYDSAELYLKDVEILEVLHEKLQESYQEIKELGLEVDDDGEDESEASDNELL